MAELNLESLKKMIEAQNTTIKSLQKKLDKRTKEGRTKKEKEKPEKTEPKETEHKEDHWKSEFIDLDCPECRDELGKTFKKFLESTDFICEDCGFPLGDEKTVRETEECPTCGSKEAKRRET